MTKLEAITALTSNEVSEIVSPDGKNKFAMVDGSIVTPRKKALDMKDLMEEGWEGKAPLNWKEHIGTGILVTCTNEVTEETEIRVATGAEEDGTVFTYGGEYLPSDAIPLKAISDLIWDSEKTEKRLARTKTKPKTIEKTKTEAVVEDSVPEPETEEADVGDAGQVAQTEPETQAPAPETDYAAGAAAVGKQQASTEPTSPTENTAKPKVETTSEDPIVAKIYTALEPFKDLGLDTVDMVSFFNFHALDFLKLDTVVQAGEEGMIDLISHYYDEN